MTVGVLPCCVVRTTCAEPDGEVPAGILKVPASEPGSRVSEALWARAAARRAAAPSSCGLKSHGAAAGSCRRSGRDVDLQRLHLLRKRSVRG